MFNEKEILQKTEHDFVIACDEVGRGPIAGPVVAASIGLQLTSDIASFIDGLEALGIDDSKKLSEKQRRQILSLLPFEYEKCEAGVMNVFELMGQKVYLCIEELSSDEIDRINILQASLKCMQEGSRKIFEKFQARTLVLVDGNQKFKSFDFRITQYPVIKGDSLSKLIGLASVIAKIFRDDLMKKYDELYPHYGLGQNAGYPTKEHKAAVVKFGPSRIHRKTFSGVREFV
ncbi:MAG: ribonuclease HII [Bacteriovoracaceae bacterium]|nr:ribonuclease HII [Bacteriovoracaceae bacterium]